MILSILEAYGIREYGRAESLVSGLINQTWKITCGPDQYILQRVNDNVFKKPYEVAENIKRIDRYLAKHSPGYTFVAPLTNLKQEEIVHLKLEGFFRLFPFIQGSHTINVVSTPEQAYEASFQFGKFTRLLSDFDAGTLHATIPNFHNLTLRYTQFEGALRHGNAERIRESGEAISALQKHRHILTAFEKLQQNQAVKKRVTHHDTKISNVLFNDQGKGICVIDLDTVMPGYFISDVGDMMRTYLSPANEEEKDFSKIEVREDFFRAIVQGYLKEMRDELTKDEQGLILYAGLFLVYMQALRFLADHCNNDSYYGARYEGQNFVRATNQIQLLKKLEEKSELLQGIISTELNEKKYFHS